MELTEKQKMPNFFSKHKKLFIFLIILAVLIILFFTLVFPKILAMKSGPVGSSQNFEEIERRDISNTVAVTGTVAAKEKRTLSTLVANTKVMEVDVKVGDRVTKGQKICVFDSSSIEEKMANLEKQMDIASTRTNESVTKAQTNVNKANTSMANDYVDNTTNSARLKQNYDDAMRDYYNACDGFSDAKTARDDAKSAYESAQSSYDRAKSDYDKIPDGYKAGTVSADEPTKTEWDNWIKEYNYWSQVYNSAKTAYDTAANKVTSYENNIQNAEKSVRTAKQNLDDANIKTDRTLISDYTSVAEAELSQTTTNVEARATNDSNKEQMDDYQNQLDNTVITSPIDGIVTSLSVTEGDEFANSTKSEVCVIQDDSGWIINGNVDQYDISNIREGMKAVVKTDATGDDEMEGVVTFVSPVPSSSTASTAGQGSSSSSSASYPIEITLNERDDRIRIGMTAETSIVLEQVENVLAVPYDSIKENDDGSFYITVADENGGSPAPGKDEGKPSASNGTFGKPVKDGDFDKEDLKKNGPPAGFGKKSGAGSKEGSELPTKDITVKKGLETDYYTEIISDEVKEGMQVLIPDSDDSSDGMFPEGDFMMVGGPGPDGGF
ncbi:MAG: efflux RND transporter periplasmic adaptor subunit [Lachnospiraceae bacterium]|nr:efflux RND transporter periplasmic adaptor subunit [Lachnospiraceae bacterium]